MFGTIEKYISEIEKQNVVLALGMLEKYDGYSVLDKLETAKTYYRCRPDDISWLDIKVMIEVIETNLNK